MSTYYELLKLDNTASQEEIEAKLDDQYTKWRSLVTHHDPNVVSQANQALQILEEMRVVLLDPGKRANYDATIASQQVGVAGLADPEMIIAGIPMPSGGMVPPTRRETRQAVEPVDRTDAWICPNCNKANVIGTQFCAKCGTRIALDCPNCGSMAELSNKFCSYCGVDKEKSFMENQKIQIKDIEQRIKYKNQELREAESQPEKFAKEHSLGGEHNGCQNFFIVICFAIAALFIGLLTESSAIGFISFVLLNVGRVFYMNNIRKKSVNEYIVKSLHPEINNLKAEIKRIQQSKYGDS